MWKGNIKIGRVFRIPILVNWSFALVLLFIFYASTTRNFTIQESGAFIGYVLTLFLCVVLHEFGHALMARRYGIETRDIILSPIGGVARLESIPEDPKKELMIAAAGPLVNACIALILAVFISIIYDGGLLPSSMENLRLLVYPSEFIRFVFAMNVALFIFNLVPAFPMDGGRILRSMLSIWMGHNKATTYATWVGKGLALVFVIMAIMNSQYIVLGMIGLFIFLMAHSEYRNVKMMAFLRETPLSDIMKEEFSRVELSDHYDHVMNIYNKGEEKNFLVFNAQGQIVGAIPELFITDYKKNQDESFIVSDRISAGVGVMEPQNSLYDAYRFLNAEGISIVGVTEGNTIQGVLDRNMVDSLIKNGKY